MLTYDREYRDAFFFSQFLGHHTIQVANRYQREQPGISFKDYIAAIGKGIPIGRMGTAQEYANLACFLASDAGSFVTGTAINLDGGACPVV